MNFKCDYCSKPKYLKFSHYTRQHHHFCSNACYWSYRREVMSPSEQPTWQGGVSQTEAHRRWKAKNPERMAFLKAARYARERGAEGSHTFDEWIALKAKHDNRCANCLEVKPLTKDHITPLSKGGSDYIANIQPLCRSCNSRKWTFIYEHPELLGDTL
jgi:5-methylcytosine-specific restriction endonuclease McrA